MNLPTSITIARIVLVPVVIWLISAGEFSLAFWCFVIAGLTDALDGYLARVLDQRTELGAYLDAVADKILLVSIYITLGIMGKLPFSLILIVVSRDVMIVGAIILSWLLEHPVVIHPLYISKINTTGQIILAATVLGSLGFALDTGALLPFLMAGVGLLTIASAAAYLKAWMAHMGDAPGTGRQDR